jgi:hypothetical protein
VERKTNALHALVLYVGGTVCEPVWHCLGHTDSHHDSPTIQDTSIKVPTPEELEHVAGAAVTQLATIENGAQLAAIPPRPTIARAEDPLLEDTQSFFSTPPRVQTVVIPPRPMVVYPPDDLPEDIRQPVYLSGRVPPRQ